MSSEVIITNRFMYKVLESQGVLPTSPADVYCKAFEDFYFEKIGMSRDTASLETQQTIVDLAARFWQRTRDLRKKHRKRPNKFPLSWIWGDARDSHHTFVTLCC